MTATILVTGGAGFIGANFILKVLADTDWYVVNLDALTYAANLSSLTGAESSGRYELYKGDIGDRALVAEILRRHTPTFVINFAAESHVDRSILDPEGFLSTNVVGAFRLLDETYKWWRALSSQGQSAFRYLHVSTDEVFGSLGPLDAPFHERTPYSPNSPYAASKAASDHFARSYFSTYGFPVLVTNCSNNFGPFQHPEKLIPLMILNGAEGKQLPIYGDGQNVRDWLHVSDHCEALLLILNRGHVGETYNIGGNAQRTNLEVVSAICRYLDEHCPRSDGESRQAQICYVPDRPGHDRRYAVDGSKLWRQLRWRPTQSFETAIERTVAWYLENGEWIRGAVSKEYTEWMVRNYSSRG